MTKRFSTGHRLETLSPTSTSYTKFIPAPKPTQRRRRPRSASPSVRRALPDFLAKLPFESASGTKKPIVRSNSFSRLFGLGNKNNHEHENCDNYNKSNDSTSTEATLNSSLASLLQEQEERATFLEELDHGLKVQTQRKAHAEEQVVSIQELAWARYDSGNEMGAVLSMRKAHNWLVQVEHLECACTQIQTIQNKVHEGFLTHDEVMSQRRAFVLILSKLKRALSPSTLSKTVVPSNEALMNQLYEIMGVVEI